MPTPQPNFRLLTPYEIDKLAEAIAKKLGKKDRILNVQQAAALLGTTEATIRMRCFRGQMPCHHRHRQLFFSENELIEFYLQGDDKPDNPP